MTTIDFSPRALLQFWMKVRRGEGCWMWTGAGHYGQASIDGVSHPAHRVSYILAGGDVPDGWHVHHKCGTPRCVRPDHLEALPPAVHLRHHGQSKRSAQEAERALQAEKRARRERIDAARYGRPAYWRRQIVSVDRAGIETLECGHKVNPKERSLTSWAHSRECSECEPKWARREG